MRPPSSPHDAYDYSTVIEEVDRSWLTHQWAHGHAETLELRVQFDTAEQQKDASTLGMWVFLITEIMFFGGMFLAYTIYRNGYPGDLRRSPAPASTSIIGAVNTGVLLLSSFTMVMAVRAAQLGQQKAIILFLILTLSSAACSWV